MNRWKNCRRSRGFTILELLVVIVIIAALAMVALPRIFGAQDSGRVGAARSDLDTIRKALAVYAAEHDAYPSAIASYDDLRKKIMDNEGRPCVTLPTGETFRWRSYTCGGEDGFGNVRTDGYLLIIQALDQNETTLRATPDGVQIGS